MPAAFWQASGNSGLWNGDQDFGGIGASGYLAATGARTYIQQAGVIDQLTIEVTYNDRPLLNGISYALVGATGGSITVPVPPGLTGSFQNVDTAVAVVPGNEIYLSGRDGSPPQPPDPFTFQQASAVSLRFTAADPTKTITRFVANSAPSVISNPFVSLIGQIDSFTDEASTTFHTAKAGQTGTLSHGSLLVSLNTRTDTSTVTLRKEGSDTTLTFSIPAGFTGWVHNTSATVTVDGADKVNWEVTYGGETGALWINALQIDYTTTNGVWSGGLGQTTRSTSGDTTTDLCVGGLNNVAGPQEMPMDGTIVSLGIYIDATFITTDSTLTWVTNGVESTSLVVVIPAGEIGYFSIEGTETFLAGDECSIRLALGLGGPASYFCIDFCSIPSGEVDASTGVIGPLAWMHWPRRLPDGTRVTDTYSDIDMHCPAAWQNGFKESRIEGWGNSDRALSHPYTGEPAGGANFRVRVSDYDRRFREQLASTNDRYWIDALTVNMTTRANRAVFGTPYTVYVGPIIEAKPAGKRSIELTLGDIVTAALKADQRQSDQHQIPWRLIRDSFIFDQAVGFEVSEHLDLETPEPIILGQHRRVPDVDPASPQGFIFAPIYLGIEDGEHVWLVAGHACAEFLNIYVDDGTGVSSVLADVGTVWRVPGLDSEPKYEDRRSVTFGNMRRYALVRGLVGEADADACAAGDMTLLVAVDGVEPNGDGSGTVITKRLLQYKHFVLNYVANYGQNCYQSGAYLTSPTWDVFGVSVPIVDEDSFDVCDAIALERFPGDGYIGAAIIGAHAGDRDSAAWRWIPAWNRSCGTRDGRSHLGRFKVVMLHPTAAIKAAAPLYTDALEIIEDTFDTDYLLRDQANQIPFRTDFEHRTGIWKTTDVAHADESITNYERAIPSEQREYPFAPGITMANHLAQIEVRQRQHPPRPILLQVPVGPDANGDSLGYRDLGDYIRYRHVHNVGTSAGEIRLAFIQRHQVQPGKRRVLVEALDVEEQIDFDAPDTTPDPSENTTCGTATAIETVVAESFTDSVDTTDNATDTSIAGLLPDGAVAYHAAWYERTAESDGRLFLTTAGSNYDTQMAVFTGDCGSLTLEQYNDNDGLLTTSVLDFEVTMGTVYRILIAGFGPDDGGTLLFGAQEYVP